MRYNWLALGDSYTIGEGVPLYESYPYQTLELLRAKGFPFDAPEIIAKTGWTTGELLDRLQKQTLQSRYDLVTILIGVNNQYRGLTTNIYEEELKKLLDLAKEKGGEIVVISIPDWGVTPFAEGRDREKIASELDFYNKINSRMAGEYGAGYVDITGIYREKGALEAMVVEDKLHPSGTMYATWSAELMEVLSGNFEKKG
ncbi:MAG: SGNH/GDSL hydrolase family protein [Chitinophagaceae bacterium]